MNYQLTYQWKCPNCGWLNENELLPVGQEGYRCIHCYSETEEDIRSEEPKAPVSGRNLPEASSEQN